LNKGWLHRARAKQRTNGDLKGWNGLKRDEGKLRILQHVLRGGNLDDHQ